MERDVPDFGMCIGADNYGKDGAGFKSEAQNLGISRRISQIPKGLIAGKSRVICVYGAGHNSFARKCVQCAAKLEEPTCGACGTVHPVTQRKLGEVRDYFVVDRIEVVLRVTEEAARNAVKMAHALGVFNAQLEEGPELLRAHCTLGAENVNEALEALKQMTGVELDADLIAPAITEHGAKIVLAAREPKRLCGFRHHGKTYAVTSNGTDKNTSPLIPIDPAMIYKGPHFRGLKRLSEGDATGADDHIQGLRTFELTGEAAEDLAEKGVQDVIFA
jgi:hypothetical protein